MSGFINVTMAVNGGIINYIIDAVLSVEALIYYDATRVVLLHIRVLTTESCCAPDPIHIKWATIRIAIKHINLC